jgi:hypothetical protein
VGNDGAPSSTGAAQRTGGEQPVERPHEDDGRDVDYLFIQAEGGLSYADLTALSSSGRLLPSLTGFSGTGWGGGADVGFRSGFFALAAHGYIARFDGQAPNTMGVGPATVTTFSRQQFDLGQVMLEAQLRLHIPVIEPYVRVGFGYAWMGNFQLNSMYQQSTSNVSGWTGKVGAGLDVWLGRLFTVGAGIDFTLLNLRRGGVMTNSTCPNTDPTCVDLSHDGDAVGMLWHFHAQFGLHF